MKVESLQPLWPALMLVWLILWFAPHAGAAADPKVIEAAKKEGQLFWWSTIAQDQSQKLIDEFMKLYHLPREAVLGYRETLYPEYRKKIKDAYVPPPPCTESCGAAGNFVLRRQ